MAYKNELDSALKQLQEMDFASASVSFRRILDRHEAEHILDSEEGLLAMESLGIALLGNGDYENGIRYLKIVHSLLVQRLGEKNTVALIALRSLGEAYLSFDDIDNALLTFEKECAIRDTLDDRIESIKAKSLYATALQKDGEHEKAIGIYKSNLENIAMLCLPESLSINELIGLGACYSSLEGYEQALDSFKMAYEIAKREYSELSSASQDILWLIIKAEASLGYFDSLLANCSKAKEIEVLVSDRACSSSSYIERIEAMENMTRIYRRAIF